MDCHLPSNLARLDKKITYEPPHKITGCVPADHLLTDEESTITPHQVNMLHSLSAESTPGQLLSIQIDSIITPLRRSVNAAIEVPLLVFLLLPHYKKRHLQKVVCKINTETNINGNDQDMSSIFRQSNAQNGDEDDHPFANLSQPQILVKLNDITVDIADIFVFVSRVSHE